MSLLHLDPAGWKWRQEGAWHPLESRLSVTPTGQWSARPPSATDLSFDLRHDLEHLHDSPLLDLLLEQWWGQAPVSLRDSSPVSTFLLSEGSVSTLFEVTATHSSFYFASWRRRPAARLWVLTWSI